MTSATSLLTRFDPRHNSLNALRLVLATLVIVSHSPLVGGFGREPTLGSVTLGAWAVSGFFGISGFLITASALRSPFVGYLWRRMLRIFPGLWACVVVVALLFAPIAAAIERGPGAVGLRPIAVYVVHNGLLDPVHAVGTTLSTVPYPHTWNGSLWTLRFEFACYLIVGAALAVPFVRRRPAPWLWGLFIVSEVATVTFYEFAASIPGQLLWLAYLGTYFWAGALMFLYRERIPLSPGTAGVATLALAVAVLTHHAQAAAALPLTYMIIWLGVMLPFQRVGRRNDISYGVYIYAFPVQQLLVLVRAATLGAAAFTALSVVCTLPFAAASWFLIERHALAHKRLVPAVWRPLRRESSDGVGDPVGTVALAEDTLSNPCRPRSHS